MRSVNIPPRRVAFIGFIALYLLALLSSVALAWPSVQPIVPWLDHFILWGGLIAPIAMTLLLHKWTASPFAYFLSIGVVICLLEMRRLTVWSVPLAFIVDQVLIHTLIVGGVCALLWGARGGGWILIAFTALIMVWGPVVASFVYPPDEIVAALLFGPLPIWIDQLIKAVLAGFVLGFIGILLELIRAIWREFVQN